MNFVLLYENIIWFFFYLRETWSYAWKQNTFVFVFFLYNCFCNILKKTRYFNTGFVSLQYQNTNWYQSKSVEKYARNHNFFEFLGFFLLDINQNSSNISCIDFYKNLSKILYFKSHYPTIKFYISANLSTSLTCLFIHIRNFLCFQI